MAHNSAVFCKRIVRSVAGLLALLLSAGFVQAEKIRLASYNVALGRDGPGLLVRDLLRDHQPQIDAVVEIIQRIRPDILLLSDFDHDFDGIALALFCQHLEHGRSGLDAISYPYVYAPPQNAGVASGIDLDGDGHPANAADAIGYGEFRGQNSMALLSRFPIDQGSARDYSHLLWRDLPDARMPVYPDGSAFPSQPAQAVMRLSSRGHWDVPVILPDGRVLHILASHPTPPVFDGPENANGRRNGDEIRFWNLYLSGHIFADQNGEMDEFDSPLFAILGTLNADPTDGEGDHHAINTLRNNALVTDPLPSSDGAVLAAQAQAGINSDQRNPAQYDTADWRDRPGPGNLRVDYVLPARQLTVLRSGVYWPAPDAIDYPVLGADGVGTSDHRLVWVDVR